MPSLVNKRHPPEETSHADDLPDRELGLNLELPDLGPEPAGWSLDVESSARSLGELQATTGRDFVIGIGDHERDYGEELFFIGVTQLGCM